ncbi:MAG: serine protease [Isosphaeraceae bacterium]|nr:MAG: serine protease [Isosphaeraceae bacterium]
MNRWLTPIVTLLLGMALMALWLESRGGGPRIRERTAFYVPPATAAPEIPAEVLAQVDADEQVNIRVYEAANPGVVNIESVAVGGFFGMELERSGGSGFVIDKLGHILTNYHVVADAEALQVTLFDGSSYPGQLIGTDPNNDVAVVRIAAPPDKLVPLPFGESGNLKVGQKVLAVGNPFGLERTLTTGIISSLDRSIRAKNGRTIKGIIQTDAAINPGNSGGPLLDTRGRVIGINTAIVSSVGQSAGIGFAVPINAITRILKPLIEQGRVIRGDLGIRRVFATRDGLFIIDMDENGPAARAGLRPIEIVIERFGRFYRQRPDPDSADRIIAINGVRVRTVEDLLSEVESHAPGEEIVITTIREGRRRDVRVRLGASE